MAAQMKNAKALGPQAPSDGCGFGIEPIQGERSARLSGVNVVEEDGCQRRSTEALRIRWVLGEARLGPARHPPVDGQVGTDCRGSAEVGVGRMGFYRFDSEEFFGPCEQFETHRERRVPDERHNELSPPGEISFDLQRVDSQASGSPTPG